MKLPCLSMWQPWASLLVHGVKKVETRGKRLNHEGPLLIHAAKQWTKAEQEADRYFRSRYPRNLMDANYPADGPLPLGAIVGAVVVERVERMTAVMIGARENDSPMEVAMGNWAMGRWAITCKDPYRLATPIPYRGMQACPFQVDTDRLGGEELDALLALLVLLGPKVRA